MSDATAQSGGLRHIVFLEHAVHQPDATPAEFGKAAFLALRLVDLVAACDQSAPGSGLFGYQAAATSRFCSEHLEPGPCTDRLLDLVRAASDAHRRQDPGLIAPAMIALAEGLREAACYEEALDVIRTLERVARSHLQPADAVTVALRTGRLERQLARFDQAEQAYERARELALRAGDTSSVLMSGLGRANVHRGRGNLVEAERCDRQVLRDAQATGEREIEARAEHDLGIVLGSRGELSDAVPHLWRAFNLHGEEAPALGALHDVAHALMRLGDIESAEQALRHVTSRCSSRDNVQNALIDLMHCASFRRNRVGFERYRASCAKEQAHMAPNILSDYLLKLGIGLARFGHFDRAAAELDEALRIARMHRLHEFEFRIERIRAGLHDCEAFEFAEHHTDAEPAAQRPALAAVSAALASLSDSPTP